MPTDPLNLGDDAKPAPSRNPDPVTIAPDLAGSEAGADNDCDGEDDRAWSDEPDTDDEFVTVRRGEDFECDDEIEESWSWTGDPLIAVFDSAKGAMAGADRYYDQRLDWWEEEPGYWMAHRPGGRMDPFNDDEDEDELGDTVPCWCGETDPLFDNEGLDATCDGSGTLICHCGGDLCVCHHHGETECPGCEHCAELEGDDDGPFEDGDENGPGWCDRCSPDPCTCDDGPDDLSDLGPLDEDEEDPDV